LAFLSPVNDLPDLGRSKTPLLYFGSFPQDVSNFVVARARHPLVLLVAIVVAAGLLSAFLVNDTICLVMTKSAPNEAAQARHPRISRSPVLPRPCPIPGLSKSRGLGSPRSSGDRSQRHQSGGNQRHHAREYT
jgi:hypothetical protein